MTNTFKQHTADKIDEICEECDLYDDLELVESEYQGKKVTLNNPTRGGSKKFYVYVKNEKGNVVKVYSEILIWKSNAMILLDGNHSEQDITVTIQDLNGKQGTGHVISGELVLK